MKRLTAKVPKGETVHLAFSGGVDSLACALYYKRKGFNVKLLHFNHGCEYSNTIQEGCQRLSERLELDLVVGYNDTLPKPKQSVEDAWRMARYRFLYGQLPNNGYLVTGHHLDDSIHTWIWSSLHGEGKIIQPEQSVMFNGNLCYLYRPFLLTTKKQFEEFVSTTDLKPVEDKYNSNYDLTRNYIRDVMMPHVLKVNPGIEKVIRKKYLNMLS